MQKDIDPATQGEVCSFVRKALRGEANRKVLIGGAVAETAKAITLPSGERHSVC